MAQSGWAYPGVTAEEVAGGYEITGHWIFGSGSNHCDRLCAGFILLKGGVPVIGEKGTPTLKVALAKSEDFELFDTWHAMGLKGIGSNDYVVKKFSYLRKEHPI